MRDGNFPIGVFGGLLEQKHYQKMRESIWLFLWLVHRQTHSNGRVLAKKFSGISYDYISSETGWRQRTIRRWMSVLVATGYIITKKTVYSRLLITIANPKKFKPKQLQLGMSSRPDVADLSRPDMADIAARCGRLKQTISRTTTKGTISKTRAEPRRASPKPVEILEEPTPRGIHPDVERRLREHFDHKDEQEQRRRIAAKDQRLHEQRVREQAQQFLKAANQ